MSPSTIPIHTQEIPASDAKGPAVVTFLSRSDAKQKCRVTVIQITHKKYTHLVRFPENGRICRRFFSSEASANAFATDQRGDALTSRQRLLLLSRQDMAEWAPVIDKARLRGVSPASISVWLESDRPALMAAPAIEQVLAELVLELEGAHRNERYVTSFKNSAKRFFQGQESKPVNRFSVDDLNAFLAGKSPVYKKSLRGRLAPLFNYAMRKNYRTDNPCDLLPVINVKKAPPQVFTVDEAKQCLEWLLKNPKGLAWFVFSAFAGMRPQDESCYTGWDKISFEERCIVVEAAVCKTHKRRVVYPEPMVFDWLKVAQKLGAVLPLTLTELRDEVQRPLRAILGWPVWKQDVTRHSAASYWLAMTNDVKRVSRSCGHSIPVLESNYDARVFQKDGLNYFALTPAALNADK